MTPQPDGSHWSIRSRDSVLSVGSVGSAGSLFSIGSFASVGSVLSGVSLLAVLCWRRQRALVAGSIGYERRTVGDDNDTQQKFSHSQLHTELVARKKWHDLSPGVRRVIVVSAVVEGVLKVAAIADLVPRPAEQVRGPKSRWAAAIILINSVGAAPIAYFAFGRRSE